MSNINFNTDVKFIKGVGEKKSVLLNSEIEVLTVRDLLYYFPFKYIDRTKFHKISELNLNFSYVQIVGKISAFRTIKTGRTQRLTAILSDGSGNIELVWFKGLKYVTDSVIQGKEYVIFGKPTSFGGSMNIVHPEIELKEKHDQKIFRSFQAMYNTTEKMKKGFLNSAAISKLINTVLKDFYSNIPESLPEYIIDRVKLISHKDALLNIHFPTDNIKHRNAEARLKFEELFLIQLGILQLKSNRDRGFKGYVFSKIGDYFNSFYSQKLPFELTGAQKRVIKEIRRDMGSGKQMNRLLQGDVGSGKTMVALMVMLMGMDNGFQTCLMAPTAVLAHQHFLSISEMVEGLNINVGLLTGATKKKARTILHNSLESGELHILIGTHALIEDAVKFKNLGVCVIDEQHKFGVAQRAKMWKKNTLPPHVLVMTATPIPRTLAMTIYGDLDVSVIDELPAGRKPIKTSHLFENKRERLYGFMREQIKIGRQIYVVYPLIQESEKMDYANLEKGYEEICRVFPPPEYAVSMVHGKMKDEDKDEEMRLFAQGKTQIMVSTTVIEVGVNVPNASVMIIESAERFGLSQLHQLRGRVGRGADQSFCFLMTDYKLSQDGRKRMSIMVESTDGFRLSEEDLKMRGPGDMKGTQQSGIPFDLKISSLVNDSAMLQIARNEASDVLDDDPDLSKPENLLLKQQLERLKKTTLDWSDIS